MYNISEMIVFQQNDSSGGEAVCQDKYFRYDFKIEGEELVKLEGERVCPAVCRGWLRLSSLSCT